MYEASPETFRQFAGTVASVLPESLRYGTAYARQWRALQSATGWADSDLQLHVARELRRVLMRASEAVPFYSSWDIPTLRTSDPAEVRAALESLPLVDKNTVRSAGAEFRPGGVMGRASRLTTTSGTAGSPLELAVDYAASAREWAFMQHHWRRAGMPAGGRRAVLRGQLVHDRRSGNFWYDEPMTRSRIFSTPDLSAATVAQYVAAISDFGADVLHAYPSTALLLADLMRDAGLRSPSLTLVLLGSEAIYPHERGLLEEDFGCPVYSWYGHTEKCVLAYDAEEPGLLSPEWLYGYVELVDDEGQVIRSPGVPGRIVGTGFLNSATVLVRYATDDWAQWAVSPEGATLSLARLSNIVAHRERETLLAHDGSGISVTYLHGAHDAALGKVREMQYVQVAPGQVRIDAVMRSGATEADLLAVQRVYGERLAGRVDVKVRMVEQIARSYSGKRQLVRTEIHAPDGK